MMQRLIIIFLGLILSFAGFAKTATINYSGKSGFVPVASATMKIAVNGNNYDVDFSANGVGIASVVGYTIKADSHGTMGSTTRPSKAHLYTKRKGQQRTTNISFSGNTPKITIQPHWKPRKKKEHLNISDLHQSIDPFSVMMRIANQINLKDSCYGSFPMTDGRSAIRVTARSKGKQTVKLKGYNGQVNVCQLALYPLSGRVMRDVEKRENTYANVYFAKISGFDRPVVVQVSGKFEGFSVNLTADKIRVR